MDKYCTNCGNPIPANAAFCPVCGQPVAPASSTPASAAETLTQPETPVAQPEKTATPAPQPTATPATTPTEEPAPEYIEEPQRSRKGLIVGVTVLVIALGVGGYFAWNTYSERQLWNEISQSTEMADYERYLNRFPNGAHHALAMACYDDLKSTHEQWMVLEEEGDFDAYRAFVRHNPESVYRDLAIHRMDSIAWAEAQRADSPVGYRRYLDRMPKGEHADEAIAKAENMEMRELTPMEEDRVTDVIRSFFSAAGYGNIDEAITLFPAEFSFMGRAANKVNVINYVRNLHGEDVYMVSVTPSNYVVQKDVDEAHNPTYAITFNLDVRTVYEGDAPDVFASYTGAAVVDSNDMITSLALRKVASM